MQIQNLDGNPRVLLFECKTTGGTRIPVPIFFRTSGSTGKLNAKFPQSHRNPQSNRPPPPGSKRICATGSKIRNSRLIYPVFHRMRAAAEYCVMVNHFHILVEIPEVPEDRKRSWIAEKSLKHVSCLYFDKHRGLRPCSGVQGRLNRGSSIRREWCRTNLDF